MNEHKMELEEAIEIIENSYVMSTEHCLDDKNIKLKQAIETVLQALEEQDNEIVKYQLYLTEDVIPKKKIEEVKKKIDKAMNLANECIEERIIIADSDSLNFGRKQAHNYDMELIRELLEDK